MNEQLKDPFNVALGSRLRVVRKYICHLSLAEVEKRSQGDWTAPVLGSYERGDRAMSVVRLLELADFYRLPPDDLLPLAEPEESVPRGYVTIDLAKLADTNAKSVRALVRYADAIRGGEHSRTGPSSRSTTLSLGSRDFELLAAINNMAAEDLTKQLQLFGAL